MKINKIEFFSWKHSKHARLLESLGMDYRDLHALEYRLLVAAGFSIVYYFFLSLALTD